MPSPSVVAMSSPSVVAMSDTPSVSGASLAPADSVCLPAKSESESELRTTALAGRAYAGSEKQ